MCVNLQNIYETALISEKFTQLTKILHNRRSRQIPSLSPTCTYHYHYYFCNFYNYSTHYYHCFATTTVCPYNCHHCSCTLPNKAGIWDFPKSVMVLFGVGGVEVGSLSYILIQSHSLLLLLLSLDVKWSNVVSCDLYLPSMQCEY